MFPAIAPAQGQPQHRQRSASVSMAAPLSFGSSSHIGAGAALPPNGLQPRRLVGPPPSLPSAAAPLSPQLVLIFVKVFGSGVNACTLQLDVRLNSSLGDLKRQLDDRLPHLHLMRLLYAGRLLSQDERELASFDLYKESTIQALMRPKSEEELQQETKQQQLLASPAKRKWNFLRRKVSEQFSPPPKAPQVPSLASGPGFGFGSEGAGFDPQRALEHGEAVLVHVLAARGLRGVSGGGWGSAAARTSDPYVLLCLQGSTARTTTRRATLAPEWGELLGLWRQIVPAPVASASRGRGAAALQRARAFAAQASSSSASASAAASSNVAAASSSASAVPPLLPLAPPSRPQAHKRDRLHVLLFSHDYLSADEPLGCVEVDMDSLPTVDPSDHAQADPSSAASLASARWYSLAGGTGAQDSLGQGQGEVLLRVQRCRVSSAQMHAAWMAAIKAEKPMLPATTLGSVAAAPASSSSSSSSSSAAGSSSSASASSSSAGLTPAEAQAAAQCTRLLRAVTGLLPFNLPAQPSYMNACMGEAAKQRWAAMRLALAAHPAVVAWQGRQQREALAHVAASASAVPFAASSPSITAACSPRTVVPPLLALHQHQRRASTGGGSSSSLSGLSHVPAHAGAFGSSFSMLSSPLLHLSSAPGSSSNLLGNAAAAATGAVAAPTWNPALFALEQCLMQSLQSQLQTSRGQLFPPSTAAASALSPLFTSGVGLAHVYHALLSQKVLVRFPALAPAPVPAVAPDAAGSVGTSMSRFVLVANIPVQLSQQEFRGMITRPLELAPSPWDSGAGASAGAEATPILPGAALQVKSYTYAPAARMAYLVCSNVEQAVLAMLRLRGLFLACTAATATAAPGSGAPNAPATSTSPGPLFAFAPRLRGKKLDFIGSAMHAGFCNVSAPAPAPVSVVSLANNGAALQQQQQQQQQPFRPMLLHLSVDGVLSAYDSLLRAAAAEQDQPEDAPVAPVFALNVSTQSSLREGRSRSGSVSVPGPCASVSSSSSSSSSSSAASVVAAAPSPSGSGLILLRTAPSSFELVANAHAVVYRFQLGCPSPAAAPPSSGPSPSASASSSGGGGGINWHTYGLGKGYVDQWMAQLKSWRQARPSPRNNSSNTGSSSVGSSSGTETPSVLFRPPSASLNMHPVPSASSFIPSSRAPAASEAADLVHEIERPLLVECVLCREEVEPARLYALDAHLAAAAAGLAAAAPTCRACLRKHALQLVSHAAGAHGTGHGHGHLPAPWAEGLCLDFSTLDLSDLLTDAEYDVYVDASTQRLLAPAAAAASSSASALGASACSAVATLSADDFLPLDSVAPLTASAARSSSIGNDALIINNSSNSSNSNARSIASPFTQCPGCKAHIEVDVEVGPDDAAAEPPPMDEALKAWWGKQEAVDELPPSASSYGHFLRNRILCRSGSCSTSFCRGCLTAPYHLGLDCGEYAEWSASPSCRFCSARVTSRNRMAATSPPCEALAQVCAGEACLAKSRYSCLKTHGKAAVAVPASPSNSSSSSSCCSPVSLSACSPSSSTAFHAATSSAVATSSQQHQHAHPCGHHCGGIRHESPCLPCLEPGCVSARPGPTRGEDATSACGVCYTEPLGAAPAIQVGCGHLQHFWCVLQRIEQNWTGLAETELNEGVRAVRAAVGMDAPAAADSPAGAGAVVAQTTLSPRIHFRFLSCALCSERLAHPALRQAMAPYVALEAQVHALASGLFVKEGLASHTRFERFKREWLRSQPGLAAASASSSSAALVPAAQQQQAALSVETAFAMETLSFMQCFGCKKPYFAGARECGPAGVGDGDGNAAAEDGAAVAAGADGAGSGVLVSDLLCSGCSVPSSFERCDLHGDEWVLYKCRYCCRLSTYHCWDSTHFCDTCHEQDEWPKLCHYASGKNTLRLYEYPQCPGLVAKIAAVLRDRRLKTPDDRERACRDLLSDPDTCPLRIRHPPNGVEHGIGCAMCRDHKDEQENKRKSDELQQQHKARLEKLRVRLQGLIPHAHHAGAVASVSAAASAGASAAADATKGEDETLWLLPPEVLAHLGAGPLSLLEPQESSSLPSTGALASSSSSSSANGAGTSASPMFAPSGARLGRVLPAGAVEYLGTEGLTRQYTNPCAPEPGADAGAGAGAGAAAPAPVAAADTDAPVLTHLCDLALSSVEPGQGGAWRCMDGVVGGCGTSTAVRTRNYPLGFVQVALYHLALSCTHYAIYLPAEGDASPAAGRDGAIVAVAAAPAKAAASARGARPAAPIAHGAASQVLAKPASASAGRGDAGPCWMRSWRLEGSNAGVHWTVLNERFDDLALRPRSSPSSAASSSSSDSKAQRRVVFEVPQSVWNKTSTASSSSAAAAAVPLRRALAFAMFRVVQTDFNSGFSASASSSHVLPCHGLELFGALVPAVADATCHAEREAAELQRARHRLKKAGGTFTLEAEKEKEKPSRKAAVSLTPGLEVPLSEGGLVCLNRGSAKWRTVRVEAPMHLQHSSSSSSSSGPAGGPSVFAFAFQILHDPATSNSWHFSVGVVSPSFNYGSRCWVGAQQASWGYIAGTGGVCNESGLSTEYGSAYGLGDVIGVRVDLRAQSIEFFKNGVSQGVAFTNVDPALGPFYPAISLHAVRATVKFIPH